MTALPALILLALTVAGATKKREAHALDTPAAPKRKRKPSPGWRKTFPPYK